MKKVALQRLYTILGVLIYFSSTYAQGFEITGHLCDSIYKVPLCPTNIVLKNAENNSFVYGVITNSSGNFKIQEISQGKYIIECSYVGYKTKKIPVLVDNVDVKLGEIELMQQPYEINEVTISYKPILEFDDENVILNIEMLGDVENLSVAEAIEMVPGAYFDFNENLNYKGYSDFTTLLDGEKTGTSMWSNSASGEPMYIKLKQIPAKFIKAVEIFPDPKGKYGYFVPIINIIPKGDLRDFYDANCDVGRYNKYNAELGVTKKKKKFTIAPGIQFACFEENENQTETRHYSSSESNSYSKETFSKSENSTGYISLSTSYRFNTAHSLRFSMKNSFYSDKTSQNLKQIEYNNGINKSIIEQINTSPSSAQYSLNYRNDINLGRKQMLMLNINTSMSSNSTKEIQTNINWENNIGESNYKLHNKKKEKEISINLGYYNNKYKTSYSIFGNCPFAASVSYSNRKLFSESLQSWKELSIYSGNNKYLWTLPNVTFKVRRKFKGLSEKNRSTHSLEATLTEQFRYEKVEDILENTEKKEKVFKTNFGFSYQKSFDTYGNYSASYNGNIRMPENNKKTTAPEYIDETTIRKGNLNLKPELTHRFHAGYSWSSSGVMVVYKGENSTKAPKIGYSFDLDYRLSSNIIIQSYKEEDGIIIYSWDNNDSYQLLTAHGSFDWIMNPKTKFRFGANYNIDKYNEKSSSTSWELNSQFKIKLLKKISYELKYRYNSSRENYNWKVFAIHDASISFSGLAFKNSVYLSFEATKLFSGMGNKTEVSGTSFSSRKVIYPESFVLWLHGSLKLFKFYKSRNY